MMAHTWLRSATPLYLRPAFSCQSSISATTCPVQTAQHRAFSSSPISNRRTRDRNPNRGVSFLHRTGFRERQPQLGGKRLAITKPLPEPNLDIAKHEKPEVDKDHGLWQFFGKKRKSMTSATDELLLGRHWSVSELRTKSWEDLHKLWWVCLKDRNRVATSMRERERLEAMHGQGELELRIDVLKQTQKHIKRVLTERWYAWEDARAVAAGDPSVDLTGESQTAYNPDMDAKSPLYEDADLRVAT